MRARTQATARHAAQTGSGARLGWEPGILNGNGDKPKWMRWRNVYRLTEEHDRLVNRSMRAVALKSGFLGRDLSD